MKLHFSTLFNLAYIEALTIVKNEQPKLWRFFAKEISIFSAVSNCMIASICVHWLYRKEIKESKKLYEQCWKKEKQIVELKLSVLFGTKLKRRITAHICFTPLYIRNIKKGFFLLPVGSTPERIMNIIVHELSHFYCYQGYKNYRYIEDDMWEISEYLVKYLINKHFQEICQFEMESYIGNVPDNYAKCINRWVNMECSFEEMLENIRLKNNFYGDVHEV